MASPVSCCFCAQTCLHPSKLPYCTRHCTPWPRCLSLLYSLQARVNALIHVQCGCCIADNLCVHFHAALTAALQLKTASGHQSSIPSACCSHVEFTRAGGRGKASPCSLHDAVHHLCTWCQSLPARGWCVQVGQGTWSPIHGHDENAEGTSPRKSAASCMHPTCTTLCATGRLTSS